MTSIQIRPGQLSDAAALAEFAARSFSDTFAADNRPEELQAHLASSYGLRQQSEELSDRHIQTLLAFEGDALRAYAQVRRNDLPACITQTRPIELHRFYVDITAHGRGLAQHLMAAARQSAQAFGAQHLWLGVWERNARAIAFYRKMGFADVGQVDFYVGPDRQTDRVMVASLAGVCTPSP